MIHIDDFASLSFEGFLARIDAELSSAIARGQVCEACGRVPASVVFIPDGLFVCSACDEELHADQEEYCRMKAAEDGLPYP